MQFLKLSPQAESLTGEIPEISQNRSCKEAALTKQQAEARASRSIRVRIKAGSSEHSQPQLEHRVISMAPSPQQASLATADMPEANLASSQEQVGLGDVPKQDLIANAQGTLLQSHIAATLPVGELESPSSGSSRNYSFGKESTHSEKGRLLRTNLSSRSVTPTAIVGDLDESPEAHEASHHGTAGYFPFIGCSSNMTVLEGSSGSTEVLEAHEEAKVRLATPGPGQSRHDRRSPFSTESRHLVSTQPSLARLLPLFPSPPPLPLPPTPRTPRPASQGFEQQAAASSNQTVCLEAEHKEDTAMGLPR